MQKRVIQVGLQGMNQDVINPNINSKQAYEIKNFRINSTANSNSIELTSEKGTLFIPLFAKNALYTQYDNFYKTGISGQIDEYEYSINGYCVINDFLVLFVCGWYEQDDIQYKDDQILKLKYDETMHFFNASRLYRGNLGFDNDHRIEAIPCYENENIQKIYWIDGLNYPRVINIAREGGYNDFDVDEDPFSFYQKISGSQYNTINVTKSYVGGLFYAGVIQYALSFYNLNSQETPIIYTTPLNYVSHSDRGEEPNKQLGCVFQLQLLINKEDAESFDYVRIYSIYRTSLNGTPQVKVVKDIKCDLLADNSTYCSTEFIDTNEGGYDFDAYRILIGNDHIKPNAIANKDEKLFLGNYESDSIFEDPFDEDNPVTQIEIKWDADAGFSQKQIMVHNAEQSPYMYLNQLSSHPQSGGFNRNHDSRLIKGFKHGETYKFGVQFQDQYGKWTPPCYIGISENDKYPVINNASSVEYVGLPYAYSYYNGGTLKIKDIFGWLTNDAQQKYTKIRPVISFPTESERSILCQGIINPTVFNVEKRRNSICRAQSSWFFRPFNDSEQDEHRTSFVQNTHNYPIYCSVEKGAELQNMYFDDTVKYINIDEETDFDKYPDYTTFEQGSELTVPRTPPFDTDELYNTIGDFTVSLEYQIDGETELNVNLYHKVTIDNVVYVDYVAKYSRDILKNEQDNTIGYYYHITAYGLQALHASTSSGLIVFDASSFVSGGTVEAKKVTFTKVATKTYATETGVAYYENTSTSIRKWKTYPNIASSDNAYNSFYYVDQSILTLNSPELDFNKNIANVDLSQYHIRKIGKVNFVNTSGYYDIIAESPLFINNTQIQHDGLKMTRSATPAYGFYRRQYKFYQGDGLSNSQRYRQGRMLSSIPCWIDEICNIFSYNGYVHCGWNDKELQLAYMVYPWQRQYLNNYNGNRFISWGGEGDPDFGITEESSSSKILKKVLSNLRYCETEYSDSSTDVTSTFIKMFNSNETVLTKLNENDFYYGNVDQLVTCTSEYTSNRFLSSSGEYDSSMSWDEGPKPGYPIVIGSRRYTTKSSVSWAYTNLETVTSGEHMTILNSSDSASGYKDFTPTDSSQDPILIRYKSAPHIVFDSSTAFASDATGTYKGFLYLGEVYRDISHTPYVEDNDPFSIQSRTWVPCGPEEELSDTNNHLLYWLEGDTYFQRYDCLKTYPFSNDDYQSVVEIASFMVETHVNLDGRYDQNRGLVDNTFVNPTNFNLINDVYSQSNNFFQYNILDPEKFNVNNFPTRLTWSLNKINGQEIDEWTRTNTAAFMDLDGDKGSLTSLRRFNNQIYAFQESGISRIKYNENVAINASNGTPIELGNSASVNGKDYLSETVGSQNKWSCITTPNGIFFVDNNTSGIYRLGYGQNGISLNNITKDVLQRWFDRYNNVNNNFIAYASYDSQMEEVLFMFGGSEGESLAYQNRYGFFSSFYDYKGWIDNIGRHSFNIYGNKIWFLRESDEYNKFYGSKKSYWVTSVASPAFQGVPSDCIFDNIWYRADVLKNTQIYNINNDDLIENTSDVIPDFSSNAGWYETFNSIEAGNDYQYAESYDKQKFIKKFRMWRVPVPRNQRGQLNAHRDRMRNTWLRFKLENTNPSTDKMVLRDIYVDSFF